MSPRARSSLGWAPHSSFLRRRCAAGHGKTEARHRSDLKRRIAEAPHFPKAPYNGAPVTGAARAASNWPGPYADQETGRYPQLRDHRPEAVPESARLPADSGRRGGGGCRSVVGIRDALCGRASRAARTQAGGGWQERAQPHARAGEGEQLGADHLVQQLLRVRHRQGLAVPDRRQAEGRALDSRRSKASARRRATTRSTTS